MSKSWLLLVPALLAPACAADPEISADTSEVFSAPEAYGVLAFLNGPDATFQVLDVDVALDRRAAQNIVDHVAVDPLDSIAELDAIPYVGPVALDKLLAYAHGHELIPDYLVETVPFSAAEADAVLAVANGATLDQLDVDAALDRRAANNIVAQRPLADLEQLAAVGYVGASALTKLKAYAPGWDGGPAPCALALTWRSDANASAWSGLLERATWSDYGPFGQVYGLAAACADTTTAEGRAALVTAILDRLRSGWAFGASVPVIAGGLVTGGAGFANLFSWTVDRLQERADDGSLAADDPTWARRDEIQAALVGPGIATPERFLELNLRTDAEECSERAAVRIDAASGEVVVVQIGPRC